MAAINNNKKINDVVPMHISFKVPFVGNIKLVKVQVFRVTFIISFVYTSWFKYDRD